MIYSRYFVEFDLCFDMSGQCVDDSVCEDLDDSHFVETLLHPCDDDVVILSNGLRFKVPSNFEDLEGFENIFLIPIPALSEHELNHVVSEDARRVASFSR